MKMLKKATAVFLSAALLLSAPAVDAIDIKSFAASNLTVSGGDSENHFSDKRENYVNEYFKYEENGKEIQTGTVINTVTFEFPSVSDLGLEIYTVTPYGDYLINAVDVSGTTSYALDFPLGGDFKARLVESGSEGSFTEFSVEIPDTDGDGIEEFGKNWGFIEHFSQELFSGVKTIDVSKFNVPNEDSNDWETWKAFNVIKDWNGIIGNALFNYDNVNGYITKINVEVYYVNSNISLDEEFKAYAHYVKSLVATLFPEGEYFTDLEKAVILNSYFCEFIGNIYGEGGNAYNALHRCGEGFRVVEGADPYRQN